MDKAAVLEIFRSTGALMEGHFLLSSGRHSPTYFQCAQVLQYPQYLNLFACEIADHYKNSQVNVVISPAIGGVVLGTEVGRQLGVRTVFAERKNGIMSIRRGFRIEREERVLVIEDVITTGGSIKDVMNLVAECGAHIIGLGVLVDRSNGAVNLHKSQFSISVLEAFSFGPDEIPVDLAAVPVQKPGSR
ncbi:MAG: orotate phosphoribosyltransferase [Candidatus Neomarinimicrobiota bacterium]|jgi:orotate phosphoribosyltransferase|nr:orotate phosphoribosyltransferase [Candidatus Neomarinimicrobiota bacterium]